MNPTPILVKEIEIHGLVVGIFQENCWIIGNRRTHEAICIDPGDQPEDILHMASEMNVQIKIIANSHAHLDHVLGVRGVQSKTNARFMLHPNALELSQHTVISAKAFGIETEPVPYPDHFIADGENIEVDGLTLRTLHTPGHTLGSVCYFTDGILFSGDTLFRGSIGRTDLPGGSQEEELSSIIDKLFVLPDETIVLPGHMQQTTIGSERNNNPFIQQELRRRSVTNS